MSGNRNLGKWFLSSKILLFASLFILIFFSVNLVREIINRHDLQQEIDKLQGQINSLESSNKELIGLIEYFKTMDFVEKEARTKLNLRKPGEQIIIVPEEGAKSQILPEQLITLPSSQIKSQPSPINWWNYFFNQNL